MKLPLKFVANSWQFTTIYDANDTVICRLDLEDWGVNEKNQDALEVEQARVAKLIVDSVNSLHTPPAWDVSWNRSYEPVEVRAKEIYDSFAYDGPGTKPKWTPGGNGIKQDEARDQARKELRAAGHKPPE
ncbi:hypothetical protein [Bradyrhizobium sp. 174]|uniref:hypothetical protein n=1 Tax=Bradyrhizobium sp. 174 TaxID=2782645 RepID=UPI001FF9D023|nr:hypothetical protein [Bradyrhizobium sp. 174]MCK1577833.1 hypothetical protein [Bradyrhizobium sp. 174]